VWAWSRSSRAHLWISLVASGLLDTHRFAGDRGRRGFGLHRSGGDQSGEDVAQQEIGAPERRSQLVRVRSGVVTVLASERSSRCNLPKPPRSEKQRKRRPGFCHSGRGKPSTPGGCVEVQSHDRREGGRAT
jgi:hypothetical protein